MIYQIRGTGGSGKSTLVRKVMDRYPCRQPIHIEGRKQPIGYALGKEGGGSGLFVPGHYETECGGCDTITDGLDYIFSLVLMAHQKGEDVLFEGMMLCSDVNRVVDLAKMAPVVVIDLNTPVDVCIDSINERRRRKKPDAKPVAEKNTRARHRMCERGRERLVEAGVTVFHVSRDEAERMLVRSLRL